MKKITKLTTDAAKLAASIAAAKAKAIVMKAAAPFLLKAAAIVLMVGLLAFLSWAFFYIVVGAFFQIMIAGIDGLQAEMEGEIVPGEVICTPTRKITAKELDKKIKESGATAFKGKGAAFLSAGEKYGVDPILVMAIAMRDMGPGTRLNNPGNLRKSGKLLKFDSMEEGIDKMTSHIYRNYIVDGLTTPKQMEKKYAPKGAPNYNPHWASSVEAQIEQLGGLSYNCEKVFAGSEAVQNMISEAHSLIGKTKYVFGGDSFPDALDCSSFVQHLYKRHLKVNLPRTTKEQVKVGKKISKSKLEPGDLVFFKNTYTTGVSHVGIYIGNNKFIHAANKRDNVIVSSLDDKYYKPRWHSARRIVETPKHDDGYMVRPVNAKISCKYRCYPGHTGVDFAAPIDTPVFAAQSGTVIKVRHLENSYGSYIVIDHGLGIRTLYAHMYPRQVKVKVGDRVKRGQVIGAVGNKGNSTGPHLHFEVIVYGVHVNPTKYIK